MKKSIIIIGLIILMIAPAGLFAQDAADTDTVVWESIYNPGNLMAKVGIGWAGYLGWGLGATGGIEAFFYQLKIAEVIPLDFSAMGRVGLAFNGIGGGLDLGIGGLVGVHFSFGGLENAPAFLEDTDVYAGLGLGFSISPNYFGSVGPGLGFASVGGANYYLTRNIAINLEYAYLANFSSGSIGVTFKL